ncbi:hypothetical protein [Hyphomicrobium sp.]|uniref:hypothetical protein n=1 Tax=Hyphomicrobium sp. TaxID=82 RepID=UPI0025C5D7D9|nr:hypothetical protein [Hyphomicrobium sp.]MCC7254261.1 hypothetical protein [Hyphomicrobium sp.]
MADKTAAPKAAKTPEEIVEGALRSIQSASRRAGKALDGMEGVEAFSTAFKRIGIAAQRLTLDWDEAGLAED